MVKTHGSAIATVQPGITPIRLQSSEEAQDSAGQVVGILEDVLIDDVSWQVAGVRVKLSREVGRDLGAPRAVFHAALLDIPRAMIKAAGDAVILSAPRSALQDLVKAAAGSELPPDGPPSSRVS